MLKTKNNNQNFSKLLVLALILTLGVILLAITYYLAYDGKFYNSLFWISVLSFGVPIFLMISDENTSQNNKIFILFLFGTILYVMRMLPSTIHFHFGDELLHFQTTELIYETGSLDVASTFEISKYYPGLELLATFLKYFTNLNIFPIAKILIGIIHSFVLVFIYLFLKEICYSERIAAIGTFIYATNPLYIFFDALFSYESVGVFFVVLGLYIVSKILLKGNSLFLSALAIIILSGLVVTHHLSSFMFLLFTIILVLTQSYKKLYKSHLSQKWSLKFTLLTVTLIFGWLVYVATIAIRYLSKTFTERFLKIFELSLFGGEETNLLSGSLSYSLLPNYEFIIDTFLYIPLLLLLASIGIYLFKKKENNNVLTYTMIIYGPILYLLSLGLLPTSGSELAQRLWGFVYIGLSFVVAVAIDKLMTSDMKNSFSKRSTLTNTFLFFILIIVLVGGISTGNKPVHREPDLLSPKLVSGAGSITTDVIYASEWFEGKLGRHNKMVGERTVSIIFNTYGNQDVERWAAWKIFIPKEIDGEVLSTIRTFYLEYYIVDTRVSSSLAEYGYYFDKSENYKNFYPIYGSTEPLPKESLDKFNNNKLFYKFYDNNNIKIYRINKWWR